MQQQYLLYKNLSDTVRHQTVRCTIDYNVCNNLFFFKF